MDDEKANEESPPTNQSTIDFLIACHWLVTIVLEFRFLFVVLFFFLITFASPSSSLSRIVVVIVIFRTFFRLGCR
jgi:hypothetical protein